MNKKIKAVLFDLDGTTVDTVGDINLALNKALGSSFSDQECNMFVGNGLRNLMKMAMNTLGLDMSKLDSYYSDLMKYYHECPVKYSHPYPGVVDCLSNLVKKQVCIGIFSNKDQDLLETVVKYCFPAIDFDFIAGRNGLYESKPNPQAVYAFCEKVNCSKDELLYVGDSEVDWKCAENAGVLGRIILGGTRTKDQLLSCNVPQEAMLGKIADILDLFY